MHRILTFFLINLIKNYQKQYLNYISSILPINLHSLAGSHVRYFCVISIRINKLKKKFRQLSSTNDTDIRHAIRSRFSLCLAGCFRARGAKRSCGTSPQRGEAQRRARREQTDSFALSTAPA